MSREGLKETVRAIMSELIDCSPEDISDDVRMGELQGWDSARHLELILLLEERFGIEIAPEIMIELTSFQAIIQALDSKTAS